MKTILFSIVILAFSNFLLSEELVTPYPGPSFLQIDSSNYNKFAELMPDDKASISFLYIYGSKVTTLVKISGSYTSSVVMYASEENLSGDIKYSSQLDNEVAEAIIDLWILWLENSNYKSTILEESRIAFAAGKDKQGRVYEGIFEADFKSNFFVSKMNKLVSRCDVLIKANHEFSLSDQDFEKVSVLSRDELGELVLKLRHEIINEAENLKKFLEEKLLHSN